MRYCSLENVVLAVTEDVTLRGVSYCGTGMIQTVVDNFDADISSQKRQAEHIHTNGSNEVDLKKMAKKHCIYY